MDYNYCLQLLSVAMSLTVLAVARNVAKRFMGVHNTLSRAVALNLISTAINAAGITTFSVLQLLGTVNQLNEGIATAIRAVMFAAMLASLLHMASVVKDLESK